MSDIPRHLHLESEPTANSEAVIRHPGIRVTVLTDRLLRIEFSGNDVFEDRASQVFLFRRLPVPEFQVKRDESSLEIETAYLRLRIENCIGDHPSVSATFRLVDQDKVWALGDSDENNLLGTARTLDDIDGPVPLDQGLNSRSGWSLIDDTESLLFDDNGWLVLRDRDSEYQDLYLFGYGNDYQACIKAFHHVSGRAPIPPRWALGNWWSRYWAYTHDEMISLMNSFRTHNLPLSVCVVDMDWHMVDVGEDIDGWTGYTWNRELFPDPGAFIDQLHADGLKTCLNLHPASGVRAHEEQFSEFAKRLGLNPDEQGVIKFDIADVDFAMAYLELLHHPREEEGIDFWWIDWQQGEDSAIPGLDPLWLLNHLHFHDLAREGRKRPLILSRWGGLGSHRYPVGFSGDAHVTWDSLAFQPYFTATAANVGYGWWSHDIGGHMRGVEDSELYLRWIQYGVFSPIFRIHSTNNPYLERRPWKFGAEFLRIARDAMQLRHALIPYIYTMAWRSREIGKPLISPMYHAYPETEEAYACPRQYLFGEQLMACPFVTAVDPDTGLSRQVVWFPPGDWYNFFTGERFEGNCWHVIYGGLDDIPIFAASGAIIPLSPRVGWGGLDNPDELDLEFYCGADGEFTLYEDNSETAAYLRDEYNLTHIRMAGSERKLVLSIIPGDGSRDAVPAERRYRLHVHGISHPDAVDVQSSGEKTPCDWKYDQVGEKLQIDMPPVRSSDQIMVSIEPSPSPPSERPSRSMVKCRELLSGFKLDSETKRGIDWALERIISDPGELLPYAVNMADSHVQALLETITQAGMERINLYEHGEVLLLWNNRQDQNIRFSLSSEDLRVWDTSRRFSSEAGVVPRIILKKPQSRWKLLIDYYQWFSIKAESDGLRQGD